MNDPTLSGRDQSDPGNSHAAAPPGLPGWVKVAGILVGILVLGLVALMVISGSGHGPARHAAPNQAAQQLHEQAVGAIAGASGR